MTTDDERRRVAAALRAESGPSLTVLMCVLGVWGERLFPRLADLIEPAPTSSDRGPTPGPTGRGIDSIYEWCRERLEGADGEEDYLYCSIMSAIEEYRHPERVTARTARPVDRGALLALAGEMQGYADVAAGGDGYPYVNAGNLWAYADRIREALGEVAS